MKVKFVKGSNPDNPNTWTTTNVFAVVGSKDRRLRLLSRTKKLLKENGFKAKYVKYTPKGWTAQVLVVSLELDPADEAVFLLWASSGIEI